MNYLELALNLANKLMDHIPNYDQRKREKFYKLKKRFIDEKNSDDRDDNLLDDLRDELQLILESFDKEISK